jgi:hypothetical protein
MSVNSKPNQILSIFNKNDFIGADELFSPPKLSDINTLQSAITVNFTKIDENFSHVTNRIDTINNRVSKSVYVFTGSSSNLGTNVLEYKAYTLNMLPIFNSNNTSTIQIKAGRLYTVSMDTTILDVSDIRILTARVEIFSNLQRIYRANTYQLKNVGTTTSFTLSGIPDVMTFNTDQNSITCTLEIIQFVRNPTGSSVILSSRVNILEVG